MSKEMAVIVLGVFVVAVRTILGVPGSWQTPLLILSGVALAVLGFLLRGEAIMRGSAAAHTPAGGRTYSFVENLPTGKAGSPAPHDHQEGITSFN